MGFDYKGIALIPIITVLVDILKRAGLPVKFAPLCSVLIGITIGILFENSAGIKEGILIGIVMGTSASGLYSNGKEVQKKVKNANNKNQE